MRLSKWQILTGGFHRGLEYFFVTSDCNDEHTTLNCEDLSDTIDLCSLFYTLTFKSSPLQNVQPISRQIQRHIEYAYGVQIAVPFRQNLNGRLQAKGNSPILAIHDVRRDRQGRMLFVVDSSIWHDWSAIHMSASCLRMDSCLLAAPSSDCSNTSGVCCVCGGAQATQKAVLHFRNSSVLQHSQGWFEGLLRRP